MNTKPTHDELQDAMDAVSRLYDLRETYVKVETEKCSAYNRKSGTHSIASRPARQQPQPKEKQNDNDTRTRLPRTDGESLRGA